ncbi:uncharacterized BrkB/YihY/UPF0761 family membrane protein [Streptomyces candidus]|uniref:Uncharacterized BrkB/YihY/UPF0761 family membrane protein n=1 Tax=Streptomyces candidus TaxID=67283 RepID=A0A7X0LQI3_9ACTN|nr:DUF202 domain-containing protein [Streptomyces candidus]MBB6436484.1 uncharacterized BrkB/YihY/UPF0761 family membrane protein [Streptomyces candidus]
MSAPVAVRDPGLQPERTRLAWRRTTLSCTVVAVLAGKQAVHDGVTAPGLLAASLSALVWVLFLVVAHRRMRELERVRPDALTPGRALAAVCCTVALAAFAVAVAL